MADQAVGQDVLAGQKLSHYRIIEQIGSGGMGVVYRAHDERLDREIAIKVLSRGALADESRRKHFRKEALVLSKLNHPNIATIHDFDTQQGVDFLVMEYIPGVTLNDKLAEASLPEKQVIALGVQLAEGLSAAHEHAVVHRDLKPGNLRITTDGRVKILDFGLAKLRASAVASPASETLSGTYSIAGTLPYMAPEQVLGGEIDARTDIHAAGAVLYEMATGQRAFPTVDRSHLTATILRRSPPPAGSLNPRLSPELSRIIRKCLEKEPEDRYQSAKELAIDLRRLQSGVVSAVQLTARPTAQWSSAKLVVLGLGVLSTVIILLLVFDIGNWRERLVGRTGVPRIESLAVLPLENLSGDPQQEYFADGMTEELISELSRIGSLKVISRTSAMQYKGENKKPLPQIGRELNVDAVLEGSVMRSGNHVRIAAQLIYVPTDQHLWVQSYERNLGDVLKLEGEVAQAIASEVQAKITPQERAHLTTVGSINPEAHELYLKGRYHVDNYTQAEFFKGVEDFREAISLDPDYAPAYAELSISYTLVDDVYLSPKETMPIATEAAKRALELDESIPEPHMAMALVDFNYAYNWDGAERELQRAIELAPGKGEAHQYYGWLLTTMGHSAKAIQESSRAVEDDPLSLATNTTLGSTLYYSRQYDPAIQQLQRVSALDPDFGYSRMFLGAAYEQKGDLSSAVEELQKANKLTDEMPWALGELGHAYARSGRRTEAEQVLAEFTRRSEHGYVPGYNVAMVYAGLGEKDEALKFLEKAYADRCSTLMFIKVDPEFDSLRSDLRFQNLLRRMNFPQ